TLWDKNGPKDYDMEILVSGAQSGRYRIQVREGRVASITTNGINDPKRTGDYWTVPGMLRTLEEELALARSPMAAFGVTDPQSVYVAAAFDPKYGFPRNFLRQVFGKNLTIDWEVRVFNPSPKAR